MAPFTNSPTWVGMADDADSNGAPLLRRKFAVDGDVKSAILYICGLGYYEAWINGRRVGDHVLDPAQTDYRQRVFYVTYDVSDLLRNGANAIGVMLGNGWYNQDRVWSKKVVHDNGSTSAVNGLSYGQPRLLAELRVIYQDGRTDALHTDTRWRWTPGPVVDNNIYAGEVYDTRREVDGWCLPEFDGSSWPSVSVLPAPGGTLAEQVMPPMRRIEERRPTKISHVGKGPFVVDLGQNFSGWARIRVEAPAGTEIKMRFAETVFADGTIDTASTGVFATTVEQIDRYICRGKGLEIWEPRFTYHGFRYIEVSGWPGELIPDAIAGIVVHTDLASAGAFECSDERLNRLHRMALWTHRSNIHGLPEDCPARERCGWLGDANLVAEYSLWNFKAKSFWEKYLGDIETSRTINNGIPGRVTPGKRCSEPAGKFDWLATYIMLPYYIYQDSGDADVLRAHWDGMEHLMAYFESEADGWILRGGYGDYFDPGTNGIVMHTPPSLTTTLWFFRCAGVMAAAASALGKTKCAAQHRDWQTKIALALTERYFDPATGSFGSQTADAMALAFGVAPAEEDRILNALVSDIRARDMHPNVGVMGVRFLFEVLTRCGHGDIALALMHQDTYPSFGHLIERGATTLWECWGEKGHDQKHGARSLNHPFMGGYDNWFYNTLAGIRPGPILDKPTPNPSKERISLGESASKEGPLSPFPSQEGSRVGAALGAGFKQFTLAPHPIPGLDSVRCHHDCRYGRIVSNWTMDSGTFEWHIEVPAGASAAARLPFSGAVRALTAGRYDLTDEAQQ